VGELMQKVLQELTMKLERLKFQNKRYAEEIIENNKTTDNIYRWMDETKEEINEVEKAITLLKEFENGR
jgi:uncharacterized coiled-coil DUF342 family protein